MDHKDGSRKRYVVYEQLFDVIREAHELAGKHTGRLQEQFANIPMQQLQTKYI